MLFLFVIVVGGTAIQRWLSIFLSITCLDILKVWWCELSLAVLAKDYGGFIPKISRFQM